MARIPEEIVGIIHARADILEVVSEFLTLKKRGANHWCKSPWTNERTASFAVNPTKGIFKDWSSGKGGNVVTFLMEHQGMTYREALEYLADKYDITIPKEEGPTDSRAPLFAIMRDVAAQWHDNALTDDRVIDYLLSPFECEQDEHGKMKVKKRGFSFGAIQDMQIGFCPITWSWEGMNVEMLMELDVLIKDKSNRIICPFGGRLIYPIKDILGRVIGFSAGKIPGIQPLLPKAKYFNTRDTILFAKGKSLYGVYEAKRAIRREGKAVLSEGAPDKSGLLSGGIDNVVCSLGTGFTEDQARQLATITDDVIIATDRDSAGEIAATRNAQLLLKQGVRVSFWLVPYMSDVDRYRTELSNPKQTMEEERVSLVERAADFVSMAAKTQFPEEMMAGAVNTFVETIACCRDDADRINAINAFCEKTSIPFQNIMDKVEQVLVVPMEIKPTEAPFTPSAAFLALLVHYPEQKEMIDSWLPEEGMRLSDEMLQHIYEQIQEGRDIAAIAEGNIGLAIAELAMREIPWDEDKAYAVVRDMLIHEYEINLKLLDEKFFGEDEKGQIVILQMKEEINRALTGLKTQRINERASRT